MVYLSKIYTKSGDQGHTGLGDGTRVPKDSLRVHSYGEVDEVNSVLGILRLHADEEMNPILERIQNDLFDLGADLCVPITENEAPNQALRIQEAQVTQLEHWIDEFNAPLKPLTSFILPGGSTFAAYLHLARTICRRAERAVCALQHAEKVNSQALIYLNRLSDLFFVLSRYVNDLGNQDVLWIPGKNRV